MNHNNMISTFDNLFYRHGLKTIIYDLIIKLRQCVHVAYLNVCASYLTHAKLTEGFTVLTL